MSADQAPDLNGTIPFKSFAEAEIDRRADEAWADLKASPDWTRWIVIGEALMYARTAIMRDTHSNRPAGRAYNAAFSAWLAKRSFGNMDGSDRARLFTVMENLAAIEYWRATMTSPERLRLNHPSTVLRKWQAATKVPDSTKPKKLSPMAQLKEAHVTVIEENEKLKKRVAAGDGNLFTRDTSPRDLARLLVGTFSREKLRNIISETQKLLDHKKAGEVRNPEAAS